MQKIRLYKIWGAGLETGGTIMYIWGKDSDDAFFHKARKIDPTCVSCQWTGRETEFEENR